MRLRIPALTLTCLALLALPVASAVDTDAAPVAAGPCDPDAGPFDPCYYDCSPSLDRECAAIIGFGADTWKCLNGSSPCFLADAGASAAACDPDNNPFDPCYYDCKPGYETFCEAVIGTGYNVWECIFGSTCTQATAAGTDATPCDPDAGPFDPCKSECNPSFELCDEVYTIGGGVWKCIFVPTCFVPADGSVAVAADASVPCPDGSLGRLFCAITNAVNEYCETEFGHPCLI